MAKEEMLLRSLCIDSPTENNNPISNPSCTVNPEARAEAMMQDAQFSFNRFESICRRDVTGGPARYTPELDTLSMALAYLDTQHDKCKCEKNGNVQEGLVQLKMEMKRTENIQQYLRERNSFLERALKNDAALKSQLNGLTRTSTYFSQQSADYINLFSDRANIEKSIFGALQKIPAFSSYMGQFGAMPALNPTPPAIGMKESLKLNDLLEMAPEESKNILTEISNASHDVSEKSSALVETTAASGRDQKELMGELLAAKDSIPDKKGLPREKKEKWQPNPLRTKRFVDRVKMNTNMQWDKRSYFLPLSGTVGIATTYQLHQRINIGVGGSFIVALGYPILLKGETETTKFHVHSNGMGFRSLVDFQLKGMLFAQCGYERNYREILAGSDLSTQWTQSALAGVKLKYPVRNKRSKPTMEIMYDFLHHNNQPAFVIRAGIELRGKHSLKN